MMECAETESQKEDDSVILDILPVAIAERSDKQSIETSSVNSSFSSSCMHTAVSKGQKRKSSSSKSESTSNNSKCFRLPISVGNPSSRSMFSEKSTSSWTHRHLNRLGIYPRLKGTELKEPVNFIQDRMASFLGYKGMKEYIETKAKHIPVPEVMKCMITLLENVDMDFNHFTFVTIESINKMKADLKQWRKLMVKSTLSDELTYFCLRCRKHRELH